MKHESPPPDYVDEVDSRFPGVAEEYSALRHLSRRLLAKRETVGLEQAVLLQCGIAWQHYHAILLLLANRFGAQGLILSRTLFELTIGTLYLCNNPSLLSDFVDFGKLKNYEELVEGGVPREKLAGIKSDCEQLKKRFRGQIYWHGKGIRDISKEVCLDVFYAKLYPGASAAVHSASTMTLTPGSDGWSSDLRHFVSELERGWVRYISFQLIGLLFSRVNKSLEMGHDEEANAVRGLVSARAVSAAAVS